MSGRSDPKSSTDLPGILDVKCVAKVVMTQDHYRKFNWMLQIINYIIY